MLLLKVLITNFSRVKEGEINLETFGLVEIYEFSFYSINTSEQARLHQSQD